MAISVKCQRVYRFIVSYKREHDGCAPTTREIQHACGYAATSSVNFILKSLAANGLIKIDPLASRSIRVVGGEWTPPPIDFSGS